MTRARTAMTSTKSKKGETAYPVLANWRFYSVCFLLCVLALAILWHVARLQVMASEDRGYKFLQDQGQARTLRAEGISAYRGLITDRHGEPLAVSTPVDSIWANPKILGDSAAHRAVLARALGMKPSRLAEKLTRYREKEFVYLKRHLPPQDAKKILDLNIPGVFAQQEYRRYYPAGEVTAHLVGFTDQNDQGQEGMELAFNDWLKGEAGAKQVLKDLKGHTIKEVQLVQAARSGKDLRLSIDLRLQYLAYRELKTAVNEYGAKSGSVVVLDVETGEVLAMVNQPAFNPNDRRKLNPLALRNRALTDQFEPGSTMKPLAVMAALETGLYKPKTKIDTNPGHYRVGKKTYLDPVNYGVIDVTKIITKSSQVGMSKLALSLEPQKIRDMYFRVGLGQATGTGFPGESTGVLPNYGRWHPIVQASYAFGYGLSLTPLQLAQAYGVIAAKGTRRPVSLLRIEEEPQVENVVDERYAAQVMAMLRTVIQKGGTATRAEVNSYPVAGKTGTVHKVKSGQRGYVDNQYLALFAGIAPANDPKIVAVVMIDEPGDVRYHGGDVAAPVFAKVAEGVLRLLRIPPVREPIG